MIKDFRAGGSWSPSGSWSELPLGAGVRGTRALRGIDSKGERAREREIEI